jgi:small subunit ribosomal protein S1
MVIVDKATKEETSNASAKGNQPQTGDTGETTKFADLLERSYQSFQEGQVVEGKVVGVDKDFVMIDIGYKSEGRIPISEFMKEDGNLVVTPGDSVMLMIQRFNPETGAMRLSHSALYMNKLWDEIDRAFETQSPMEGKVVSKVKGGLSVLIGEPYAGIHAFMPLSQVDIKSVSPDSLMGETLQFLVIKLNRKKNNIIISRRLLLEQEKDKKKAETLSDIEIGQVREGVIKNITDYGVFVDLGGIDGLLHVTDISWGRIEHPAKIYNVGDRVNVKVLAVDPEKERISLGVKQLTENPWLNIAEKYPVSSRVKGNVVSIIDYGAFVELEEGVEGLVHISEMSWTKRIRHPSHLIKVGDRIDAVVLNVTPEEQRISLGLKQIEPNPWDLVEERYPVGTVLEGKVKNLTDFGLFMGIEEGIDGLVHISDLTWNKKIRHPKELYKKGDTLRAVILNIDKEKERFSLGVKQLAPDPWQSMPDKYPVGSTVTGKVTNVADFGVFVKLEEGVEGLIHVSELNIEKGKTPEGLFEKGQEITAKVIHIAPLERRIGLSIKRLKEDEERAIATEYSKTSIAAPTTIGGLIQEEMLQKRGKDEKTTDDIT